MFIKIRHYPSALEDYKDPYDVVLNTEFIISIKPCRAINPSSNLLVNYVHLSEDVAEDGYCIATVDKPYYIVYEDAQELIKTLTNHKASFE